MKLTDRTVKTLKPRATGRYERFDDTVPGLAIRVNSGNKSWVLFYRERLPDLSGGFAPGKRLRRLTLGTYPALSLASARTKAQRALHALTTQGIDPAVGKREARHAESFGELATDYLERHAKPNKRSWKEDQRQLTADVLPYWQSRPVKAITRRDVRALLDRIVDRGAPVTANRVLALVSRLFTYGIDKDWLDSNPAARISKQKEKPRDRVLTDKELKGFMTVLKAVQTPGEPLTPMMARGLELMLRTAQRGGEVFAMRWKDVDEGWWTIPGERTKNGEAHRVPLTTAALALLAEARVNSTPKSVISGPDGLVFVGPEGGSLHSRAVKVIPILRNAGVLTGDYWRHDLRRTVITTLAKLGIPRAVLSQVLNHNDRGPRATAVYDRYDYDGEKRTALEAWGRHLDALLTGHASRVVPFSGGRTRC